MADKLFSIEKLEEKNRYIVRFFGLKLKLKMSLSYLIQKQLIKLSTPLIKLLDIIIPKDKNKVIFTSYPDFSDSAKIFYDYLKSTEQDKFKKIRWIYTEKGLDTIPDKKHYLYTFSAIYHLLTAKYIIHDHCDKFFNFLSSNKRVLFNLWHGMPIKAIGLLDNAMPPHSKRNYKYMAKNAYMFIISDIYRSIMSSVLGINPNNIFITGQARTDVMFNSAKRDKIIEKFNIDTSKKIVIYTPTYKKRNKNDDVKTQYENIFYLKDYSDTDFLNFLEQNNICMIIKPHPFEQKEFKKAIEQTPLNTSNNVKILYNEDFTENNLMLNEIFPLSDLIISDFSSVTIDYAMLNKPILYLNNYLEEYKNGRGFILPDNSKILMPGENVTSYEELKNKILKCLSDGSANYTQQEVDLLHKFKDGNSCERIFEVMKGI